MPQTVATAVMCGKVTYADLDGNLSLEDLYDIIEIAAVETENRRRIEGE